MIKLGLIISCATTHQQIVETATLIQYSEQTKSTGAKPECKISTSKFH